MCRRPRVFAFCQRPLTRLLSLLTIPIPPLARSIGDIGDKGASALAAILKETMISDLECAAA